MLKKLYIIFILMLLVLSGCSLKKAEPSKDTLDIITNRGSIIVGIKTDSYPFGYSTKNGGVAGYDVEIGKIIAKGIFADQNKVKFVPVTSSDRIMKLYSNDVDMIIATMSVTQKRKEIVDFSDSYFTAGQSILVRKGSNVKNIKDLKGKRVIIVFGSTSEQSIRSTIPNVQIIGYKTYNDAYKALKNKKGEALISDNSILLGYTLKDSSVVLLPKLYTKEPYAIAFRKEEESQRLKKTVNEILETETKRGTLKKLQKTFRISN